VITTNKMTKRIFLWPTLFVLVATAAAWLPGDIYRQRSPINLRSQSMDMSLSSVLYQIDDENEPHVESSENIQNAVVATPGSRRSLFRRALVSTMGIAGFGSNSMLSPQSNIAQAYTITKEDPDENDIYAVAQNMPGNLKVLWIGSGPLEIRTGGARSGVYKNLFKAGNEVYAVDLLPATDIDYRYAKKYAKEQGYVLRYQQGDARKLDFADETFDVVVSSCFLSQPFDPLVVVNEISRVLKTGGRFGFFEHKTDIDTIVVDKVFGEASIIKLVAYPELQNILAGVVRKM